MLIAQGDLLLRRIAGATMSIPDAPPGSSEPQVLAEGEGSGHLHRLHAPFGGAVMFLAEGGGGVRHGVASIVGGDGKLLHEYEDGRPTGDHAEIDIPEGTYEVIYQREHDEEELLFAMD